MNNNEVPYIGINPYVFKHLKNEFRIGISKFVIVDYIYRVGMLQQIKNPNNRILEYVQITATSNIIFGLSHSVISKALKQLMVNNIIHKEAFGFKLNKTIKELYKENNSILKHDYYLLNYKYYKFVETPEKAIILHFLIDKYFFENKKFVFSEIDKDFIFSKNSITNLIQSKQFISLEDGFVKIHSNSVLEIYHIAKNIFLKNEISNLPNLHTTSYNRKINNYILYIYILKFGKFEKIKNV